jgi:hypothetical protein
MAISLVFMPESIRSATKYAARAADYSSALYGHAIPVRSRPTVTDGQAVLREETEPDGARDYALSFSTFVRGMRQATPFFFWKSP